ncbi:amino acid permease [Clostridium bowmanii]|uniref:amino acid permease n=1 Tax=Clostridium bowmanii TaxID=132925 RepID=UPI001C0E3497|nr:amino acid permease [Clostridium bowmanii]MBU3190490.1 amino acid permease [Clostridium bowmanii]MCA1074448.1 amino acid permease [Clostridium bowmanii]
MSKINDVNDSGNVKLKRELGLAAATAIVVGNCIGSGIFTSAASLAAASNPKTAMLAWIITAIGSLLIALSFASLGTAMPRTGGPIVYTRAAFGNFAGFLIAWTYWIGAWVGNAAIITAFMLYFTYFFPGATTPLLAFLITSAVLWFFTIVNILGVKGAGMVSIVTTVLKISALVVFVVIAGMHFNPDMLSTVSSAEVSGMGTLPAAIAIALWAFVGIESATVPAGEIKDPEKNIRKSTIYGTLIAAAVYLIVSIVAMGVLDQATLAGSKAPLADIINAATGGTWGGNFIAIGAIISTLGATSGWVLTTARSAFGAAQDKLFPEVFGRVHPKYKTPVISLVISGVAANILLILNYVGSLNAAFNFMLLLATLAFLPAYAFSAAADIVLLKKHSIDFNIWNFLKNSFVALLAFAYSIYAIYGTGSQVVMYGFILMLVGIPVYLYMMLQNNKIDKNVDELRKKMLS